MTWVFVYAAESGPVHAALDWAHKLVSPATYACDLCRVTYGIFGRRADWEAALGRLNGEKQFLHGDEFRLAYPDRALEAPSVWLVEDHRWSRVIGPDEWDDIDTVAALERRLTATVQP